MNKQDLRVIKTNNAIKTAFSEMLESSPVEKITVSALAKHAQINKATFYLHYQDIYDLYNEIREDFLSKITASMDFFPLLLDEPREFLDKFSHTLQENFNTLTTLWPENDIASFYSRFNDFFIRKMYETYSVESSIKNDITFGMVFHSIYYMAIEYYNNYPEITLDVFTDVVNYFIETYIKTEN